MFFQQRPTRFGFSYRVMTADAYRLHLVYNATVDTSEYVYDQDEVTGFRWDFSCLPISVPDSKKSAHIILDGTVAYSWAMEAVEDILYGTDEDPPRLPLPEELWQIIEDNSILVIIDHGDGTWTASGPEHVVDMLDATTFQISWPSAIYLDADTYTVSSL